MSKVAVKGNTLGNAVFTIESPPTDSDRTFVLPDNEGTIITTADIGTIASQDSDNVSISGGTIGGITDLAVEDGGTGASNDSDARVNLGLGDVATQSSDNINIDGGTIDGTAIGSNAISSGSFNVATVIKNGGAALRLRTAESDFSSLEFGVSATSGFHYIQSTQAGSGSVQPLDFYMGASPRMRIDASGHAIIPAGVTLGTSAGVYNAANTLDDYEEGTWTPASATGSVTPVDATYTKVGRIVYLKALIRDFTDATSAINIVITGLPFTISGTDAMGVFGYSSNVNYSESAFWQLQDQGNILQLRRNINSGTTTDILHSDLVSTDSIMYISIVYTAD